MKPYNPRGIYWPRETKRSPRFDQMIVSLKESGLSFSQIADLMAVLFDDDTINRNTVSGRIFRLKKQAIICADEVPLRIGGKN